MAADPQKMWKFNSTNVKAYMVCFKGLECLQWVWGQDAACFDDGLHYFTIVDVMEGLGLSVEWNIAPLSIMLFVHALSMAMTAVGVALCGHMDITALKYI